MNDTSTTATGAKHATPCHGRCRAAADDAAIAAAATAAAATTAVAVVVAFAVQAVRSWLSQHSC